VTGSSELHPWPAWLNALREPREIARIWATVDLDRSLAALGRQGERLAQDPLLGAHVALVRSGSDVPLAVLEPSTEGRMAGWLARSGEGVAGSYVGLGDGMDEVRRRAAVAGALLSAPADGPFGASVLVLGGAPGAPNLILVPSQAGTIGR